MSATHNIDKLDRAILRRLQANGRETYDVIGEQVGLSPSAVLRRVKRLEDGGDIDRYVALVQPETVGLGLTRSEEHTSELQSQSNLVCRLLLEKKKNTA